MTLQVPPLSQPVTQPIHEFSARPPQPSRLTHHEILRAFQGKIKPVRVPLPYRLGVLLVALVMVLLPVIYLGITFLVAYVVYYHAVNDTALLSMGSGRGQLVALLIYLAPIVIGAILVLFMFKPLFSRPPRPAAREPLRPEDEPLLFAFVERVCDAVGASRPRAIELDCEVNASARFRRGFLSMFGNDLVLTIGMPLVAGLTMDQFAGVLAHEFGHFAQGVGMRLTYLIRSISHWFTRVVYERDEWDERLIVWSKTWDLRVSWIIYLARGFVWGTRKILWALMMVGHGVSAFLLRQMEFDADRHEIRLVGSAAFESTMRQIVKLSIAARGAHADLGDFYREGRLGDNLPQLILHNLNQFAPAAHAKIEEMIATGKTDFFATHPSEQARITRAQRENVAGIFHMEEPATLLFHAFETQCVAVTIDFYHQIFGERFDQQAIHQVDELLVRQEAEQTTFQALHRYFQGIFRVDRPLVFPSWYFDKSYTYLADAETAADLAQLRTQLVARAPRYRAASARTDETQAGHEPAWLNEDLVEVERLVGERLVTALQLLATAPICAAVADALTWDEESRRLLPILKLLNDQIEALHKLHTGSVALTHWLQALSADRKNRGYLESLLARRDKNLHLLMGIRNELNAVDYPFEHAKGSIWLGTFVLAELPHRDDIRGILTAAEQIIGGISRLRARITGELCVMAEAVEAALGLEPLAAPTDEDHS
ncbi:MAG TPA: M48 family metallopeptidase [Caldilineaceae bacterium]|nr:M48 family metallopeptidase [Caldilineaceae bacterium]